MPTEYTSGGENTRFRTSIRDFVDPTVETHMSDDGLVIDGIYKADPMAPRRAPDEARNIETIRIPAPGGWALPERQQTE